MKVIFLKGEKGRFKYATVDDEDYEYLNKFIWWFRDGYAQARIDGKLTKMHRLVMKITDPNIKVDHCNHNTLDNRKEKLRICTYQQNNMNAKKRKNSVSQYKGVSWQVNMGKWRARIQKNRQVIELGYFDNEDDAGRAYNKKAEELFGEFACLNVMQEGMGL